MSAVPTTFPETVTPTEADTGLPRNPVVAWPACCAPPHPRLSVQADDDVEQSASPVAVFRLLANILIRWRK